MRWVKLTINEAYHIRDILKELQEDPIGCADAPEVDEALEILDGSIKHARDED